MKGIVDSSEKSRTTVAGYLRIARNANVIEFKGAPKTGGYYLTEKMKKQIP